MEISYRITENDFVDGQMFHSAHDAGSSRRRLIVRVLASLFYLGFAFVAFNKAEPSIAALFFVGAILLFLFLPKWTHWRYRRHFAKHYQRLFQGRLEGESNRIIIEEDGIRTYGFDGESYIKFSGIIGLKYDDKLGMVRIKPGQMFLLPISEIGQEKTVAFLQELSRLTDISVEDHRGWKWR
ncbi:hypothetical protein [Cerasicoccus fimbriatus]|uniref:hypothetical protein n=1 Tax=Cerasicoccus fimbriatus TaxID=3014554 RepID=UPI0022B3D4B7|nr:hypothetical protein [Cerasicoccus sp. TK19100]